MATEDKDVKRLFIAEASFIAGSIQKQLGWDPTAKKLMVHETDDSKSTISEDSLLVHLAGTETITGNKTIEEDTVIYFVDANTYMRQSSSNFRLSVHKELYIRTTNNEEIYLGGASSGELNIQYDANDEVSFFKNSPEGTSKTVTISGYKTGSGSQKDFVIQVEGTVNDQVNFSGVGKYSFDGDIVDPSFSGQCTGGDHHPEYWRVPVTVDPSPVSGSMYWDEANQFLYIYDAGLGGWYYTIVDNSGTP